MGKTANVSPLVLLALVFAVSLSCNAPMISNTGANNPQNTSELPSSTPEQPSQTPVTLTVTNTPVPPTAPQVDTVTPTLVPIVNTPTNPVAQTPCNKASFIADVNYPDGTEVFIDKNFTKTWRLQNVGTCTWTSGYRIIFDSGDRMSAPDETVLTNGSVNPGEMVDISVQLKSPPDAGTYKGYYRLKSSDNVVFGINNSGTDAFWVEIKAVKLQLLIPVVPLHVVPTFTSTPWFKKLKPGIIVPIQP